MNHPTSQASQIDSNRAVVLQACRAMLRPIVRLLLKNGIVHRDLIRLTREVYVDIARTEFGLRGRPTSISRTALLTGLARKEVRRIMNILDCEGRDHTPSAQDRITRVLSGWFQDEDYLTRDGQPRAIPAAGPAPSFADLKSRYGGDVPASAMLRELLRAGTVVRNDDGMLHPTMRNFAPNPADPEHLLRAGSVMEDLGTTVMRNLYRPEGMQGWFERRAVNTNMAARTLQEFQTYVEREGQRFLEDIDGWMTANEANDVESTPIRLGLGMYIIHETPED